MIVALLDDHPLAANEIIYLYGPQARLLLSERDPGPLTA